MHLGSNLNYRRWNLFLQKVRRLTLWLWTHSNSIRRWLNRGRSALCFTTRRGCRKRPEETDFPWSKFGLCVCRFTWEYSQKCNQSNDQPDQIGQSTSESNSRGSMLYVDTTTTTNDRKSKRKKYSGRFKIRFIGNRRLILYTEEHRTILNDLVRKWKCDPVNHWDLLQSSEMTGWFITHIMTSLPT